MDSMTEADGQAIQMIRLTGEQPIRPVIISGPGHVSIAAVGFEPITFSTIAYKVCEAILTYALEKIVDAMFEKHDDASRGLKDALDNLIREIAVIITSAVERALDNYHATEAIDLLMAVGDNAERYQTTHHLPWLETALGGISIPTRRLKSLDPEVGYGPFCMAASLEVAIAHEMLRRKSPAMDEATLAGIVDKHEAYARSQHDAILTRIKDIKVGAIIGNESVFAHPATNIDDPGAPEKRDILAALKTLGYSDLKPEDPIFFRIWAQKPEKYDAQGWTVIRGTWEEFTLPFKALNEFYGRLARLRRIEAGLENELERITRERLLTPAEKLRDSWQTIRVKPIRS
jgi:hypothetical protein